jgi:hypothetical protein
MAWPVAVDDHISRVTDPGNLIGFAEFVDLQLSPNGRYGPMKTTQSKVGLLCGPTTETLWLLWTTNGDTRTQSHNAS